MTTLRHTDEQLHVLVKREICDDVQGILLDLGMTWRGDGGAAKIAHIDFKDDCDFVQININFDNIEPMKMSYNGDALTNARVLDLRDWVGEE